MVKDVLTVIEKPNGSEQPSGCLENQVSELLKKNTVIFDQNLICRREDIRMAWEILVNIWRTVIWKRH